MSSENIHSRKKKIDEAFKKSIINIKSLTSEERKLLVEWKLEIGLCNELDACIYHYLYGNLKNS